MWPQVSVLVLNWNNWKDTAECLRSLSDLDYDNCKVMVLDNGSTDGSVERIRGSFPSVEMLELGDNLGFAKANNRGIRAGMQNGSQYVWLLNNDTTVDPHALRTLVEKAEANSKIAAVGSAIYSSAETGRLQTWGGGRINLWWGGAHYFVEPVEDGCLDFLTGASLLVRCSVLEELGLLDETFFLYWEDADFCFRLRRSNWQLAVSGDSKVWHKESATIGPKSPSLDFQFSKSAVRFYQKNSKFPMLPILISVSLRIAKRAALGEWERARAVWAGSRGGILNPVAHA
jgi:GT2 family glycosyltransferase